MNQWKAWTLKEDREMRKQFALGFSASAIAHRLGRNNSVISRQLKQPPMESRPVVGRHYVHSVPRKYEIPDHVLADRDRRLAMYPRDLTALLMGDPVR